MNKIEITESEKKDILEKFIECFKEENNKDGKKFENFLGKFLPQFDFDEVCVTQYSRDGGIDLTAIRKGFDIKGADNQNYYIQAKCYAIKNTVSPREINELRGSVKKDKQGNVLTGCINVFITTSTFSKEAIRIAEEDIHRPVILIDGYDLIDMCIQKGIGFDFKPVFDPNEIKLIINKGDDKKIDEKSTIILNDDISLGTQVEKTISRNDVRARILPLPQAVKNTLVDGQEKLLLRINGKQYNLNIDKGFRYLAGVTDLYRNLGMIKYDGVLESKVGKWYVWNNGVELSIEEDKGVI